MSERSLLDTTTPVLTDMADEEERMCREIYFTRHIPPMPQRDRQRVQWAYTFGKEWHRRKFRDSGKRYFEHPRSTSLVLSHDGSTDADEFVEALMHDVPEDHFIAPSLLEQVFGHRVAREILSLSKCRSVEEPITGRIIHLPKRSLQECLQEIEALGRRPIRVKCADRISNMMDLADGTAGSDWPAERRLKKVAETRELIIPLADRHEPRFALRLRGLCDLIEARANLPAAPSQE